MKQLPAVISVTILTMSDKGSRGERVDESGAVIRDMLPPSGFRVEFYEVIPDEMDVIKEKLIEYSGKSDLILTSGGTGLSPRDVTPEATLAVIDREVRGIPEAIRSAGMNFTDRSMLSRAVAGVRGRCLIINLPGSPKAVRENLSVVLGVIPHAVEKIKGSQEECAR